VHSARFAGEGATDAENVSKLLGLLGEAENRSARFVCALCLILPQAARRSVGARMVEVEGAVEGSIAPAPRGHDGFGYDPIFIPTGWSNTLAEAEPKDKDGVSHRGAACRALTDRLFELGVLAGGAS
jgi:XTP/dITP diphosphohydrolase